MELPALITLLLLVQYIYFVAMTGRARGTLGIHPPAVTGNETFERRLRIQLNTLEQLIITIPAIWLCSVYIRPDVAAGIGSVFLVGRFLYGVTYLSDPRKRGPGMVISFFSNIALVILALGGLTSKMF